MRVGSLFSGAGGLDLGLEQAGHEVVWQCEINPFCQKVIAKHWNTPLYGDVKSVQPADLASIDVLCGGPPCQPFSNAGKRRTTRDSRWLWPEFARFVRHFRPRFVLLENVQGFLRQGMGPVLGDLAVLGYDAEWRMLPAAYFGAPHVRHRVFVVAYPCGQGVEGLLDSIGPGETGPWGWRGEEDLRALLESPFGDGRCWPTPLFRRVDDGIPHRMDRLIAIGNSVVPEIARQIGVRLS